MLLEVCGIGFSYPKEEKNVVEDLSFKIDSSERVGLAAPTGGGKTTVAKILSGYYRQQRGKIFLDSKPLTPRAGVYPVQLMFQNPQEAVNPSWTVRKVLGESGDLKRNLLRRLEILPQWLDRPVRELSLGQLQVVCLARTLLLEPRFIVADEITSMMDTVTQARIWSILLGEAARRNVGLIVITHNYYLRRKVCTRTIFL